MAARVAAEHVGKALGQPVWRLLGGKVNERIKAYANGWYTVERTPEEFRAFVKAEMEKWGRVVREGNIKPE